ncbi:MAG: retroviral-like aspartic protease family protein [Chloroflexi bacterium]|nr:retroviral-like aspartic protease family protein [Chloroflexota bacterium]
MTTFRYQIEIGDSGQETFETLEAWVDTGASYTLIPKGVMERLGHGPTHQRPFRLADGSVVELGLCQAPLRIGEETAIVSCVFGDENTEPLLGATALEEFGLGVDPINHTLIPIVMNLLGFDQE